ncbi:unnamed protein product [Oikopleura dioica]|uniref:HAT C-terminal dimerisation domain-containing protein n=1 Tax=Oikopleura dioica TaxID=34765 RepID=E4XSF6_OIKDI|nr:unnamed protein product [Oikopleura dioica]
MVSNATTSLSAFYKLNRQEFPRLEKIVSYLTAITCSSSEMERSFAVSSAQVKNPAKNRTKAKKIEQCLQMRQAGSFKDLLHKIFEKENLKKFF